VVMLEDVILSLLGAQLSVNSVGILPETMMYIAVLNPLSVLLPYTVVELLSIGLAFFPFEYTTLHIYPPPPSDNVVPFILQPFLCKHE
jgi:hypothetical protein